jgi:hypothetical protein
MSLSSAGLLASLGEKGKEGIERMQKGAGGA